MEVTKNYALNKPEQDDFYDVDDFNKNADIIDEELAQKATAIQLGRVKVTDSSAVTDSTGLALPATEKNAALEGTMANQIAANAAAIEDVNNNLLNKVKFNESSLSNIKFVFGEYTTNCTTYDSTLKKYTKKFTVDNFSNFYNNTLAFIPIACFNELYPSYIIDCSIDGNWVSIQSDSSTDNAVIKVLMIQYDVS